MKNSVAIILILIAGFLVYINALPNGFVWDDEEQIVNNAVIRDWENLPLLFTSSTFYAGGAGLSGGFYRPIVSLSYLFNYHVWGLMPFGFRIFQLLFHLFNLVLIFYLLKKILDNQKIQNSMTVAGLAVLLFAVQPANVESVAYLGSIGEILYTFFILLGIFIFITGINYKNRTIKNKNFDIAFLLIFCGLLAKETAVVALPLLFFYLWIFVKPRLKVYLSFFFSSSMTVGAYLILRFFVAKISAVQTHYAPISIASFWERIQTIPLAVLVYLKIIFFPNDLSISRHFVVASSSDIRFWGALAILLASAVAFCFYFYKTRAKIPFFFSLWFFVSLAPALNVIPLEMTTAERWLYFPLIGMSALVSLLVVTLIGKTKGFWRHVFCGVLVLIIMALAIRTVIRNADWKDGLTLYTHDVKIVSRVSPKGSFDLENNCGVELFRAGKIDEAEGHFRKSVELQPRWPYSQNNLGAVLEQKNDLEGALAQYKKAIEVDDYYLAYENVGGILIKMKKYGEAKDFIEKSLLKFPQNNKLKLYLAWLYAADNVSPKEEDKQKALILLSQILYDDPQNIIAQQLYLMLQNGQKIEI